MMGECWMENPEDRPNFYNLVSIISRRLESIAGYLDLRLNRSTGITAQTLSSPGKYGQGSPTVVISDVDSLNL